MNAPARDTSTPTPSSPIDIPQAQLQDSSAHRPDTPPLHPSSHIWTIRHQMYFLKDEVVRIMEWLSVAQTTEDSESSQNDLLKALHERYRQLFDTVSIILSNHGSDWIEHALAGGLTYIEFAQIDSAFIHNAAVVMARALGDGDNKYFENLRKENLLSNTSEGSLENQSRTLAKRLELRQHICNLLEHGGFIRLDEIAKAVMEVLSPARARR